MHVTLVEERELGGALLPVTADGFTWDVVATRSCRPWCATCSARPAGRWRRSSISSSSTACVSTGSRTAPRSCSRRGGRPSCTPSTRSGRDSGSRGSTTCESYADDWEVLRRGYLEVPWDPDALPREVAARLESRETLAEAATSVPARPACAAGGGVPLRGRRSPASRRTRVGRAHVVPRAALRRVGGGRRDRRTPGGAGTTARHPRCRRRGGSRGRHRRTRRSSGSRHHERRRARRRRRGLCRRPASAPGAGAVRRAHDARDPARAVPRRPRGRGARPAPRAGRPRRGTADGPHGRAWPPRVDMPGRWPAADASPRTRWPRSRGTGSTSVRRWSPASTVLRASSSSSGAGPRWGCSGKDGAPSAVGSARATPVDGVYAAGSHATPGSGLPFVGSVRGARGPGRRAGVVGPRSESPVNRRFLRFPAVAMPWKRGKCLGHGACVAPSVVGIAGEPAIPRFPAVATPWKREECRGHGACVTGGQPPSGAGRSPSPRSRSRSRPAGTTPSALIALRGAHRSPTEATALDDVLHVAEPRAGEPRQVGRPLDRVGVRRLAGCSGGGGLVGDLERDPLDLEPVAHRVGEGGEQPARGLDVGAADDQRVAGLEARRAGSARRGRARSGATSSRPARAS